MNLDILIVGLLLLGVGFILIKQQPSVQAIEDRVMNMSSTCDFLYGNGMYTIMKEKNMLSCKPSLINLSRINWSNQGVPNAN